MLRTTRLRRSLDHQFGDVTRERRRDRIAEDLAHEGLVERGGPDERGAMVVQVYALAEGGGLVAEQLGRVLRGDAGPRMDGLRRVAEHLDRDPVAGLAWPDAGAEHGRVERGWRCGLERAEP